MIEPYDLIYYEEQFIKPPKRGKLYSKDEFASYTSKIACIGGQLHGNFVALEKLAKQIDKEINQKVGERRWVESNVKELFFSYRGRVYSIVNFHARKLENKSTWTYDNVITLHRKTVEDVVKELNKAVAIANDPVFFDTKEPAEFIDRFHELDAEFQIIVNPERWVFYFEEKYFRTNLLASYRIGSYYGRDFEVKVGKTGEVVSSRKILQALLRKTITLREFETIVADNYAYYLAQEIKKYQTDKATLKKYIEILHTKFVVNGWKMTYGNISKALDVKIQYGDLRMVYLPGVTGGFSLKDETIQPILDRYRLILSLDEQQIKDQLFKNNTSSSDYGFMKPKKMIEAKTLPELYQFTPGSNESSQPEAQAQRIRILKLKYKYQR